MNEIIRELFGIDYKSKYHKRDIELIQELERKLEELEKLQSEMK